MVLSKVADSTRKRLSLLVCYLGHNKAELTEEHTSAREQLLAAHDVADLVGRIVVFEGDLVLCRILKVRSVCKAAAYILDINYEIVDALRVADGGDTALYLDYVKLVCANTVKCDHTRAEADVLSRALADEKSSRSIGKGGLPIGEYRKGKLVTRCKVASDKLLLYHTV